MGGLFMQSTCEYCSKLFEHRAVDRSRFCSRECKNNSGRQDRECPTCHKIFTTYKSFPNARTYCSDECRPPKVDKIPVICEGCNKSFLIYPSQSATKFCSKECRAKVKSIVKPCEHCGKDFHSFVKANRHHCSRECQKAAKRIDTTCPACGKAFWYNRSWPRIYCCQKCSVSVNAIKNLGIVVLPEMHCEQCGDLITENRYAEKRFCSQSCFGAWQSIHITGENHPMYSRVERTCKQCQQVFLASPSEIEKGWAQFCNTKCRANWQKKHPPEHKPPVMRGEDNPNWKGGHGAIYYGPNWYDQRRLVRKRDDYICQHCGISEDTLGQELDVHHIVPFRDFGESMYEEANQIQNLICLCKTCHKLAEHKSIPIQPFLLPVP